MEEVEYALRLLRDSAASDDAYRSLLQSDRVAAIEALGLPADLGKRVLDALDAGDDEARAVERAKQALIYRRT